MLPVDPEPQRFFLQPCSAAVGTNIILNILILYLLTVLLTVYHFEVPDKTDHLKCHGIFEVIPSGVFESLSISSEP